MNNNDIYNINHPDIYLNDDLMAGKLQNHPANYQNNPNGTNSVTAEEMDFGDMQEEIDYSKVGQENLENAFIEELINYVATDAYSAAAGNYSTVKAEYWTDKPLRFSRHEKTGSYLIEQEDENGNWVAMGYTNEEAATKYLEAIRGSATQNSTATNSKIYESLFDKLKVHEEVAIYKEKLSDPELSEGIKNYAYSQLSPEAKQMLDKQAESVSKEVAEYRELVDDGITNEGIKKFAYNNLSTEAKVLVNEQTATSNESSDQQKVEEYMEVANNPLHKESMKENAYNQLPEESKKIVDEKISQLKEPTQDYSPVNNSLYDKTEIDSNRLGLELEQYNNNNIDNNFKK